MAEGRSWDEIDEMTLLQVGVLNRHYRRLPPLRALLFGIASALGVKFPELEPAQQPEQKPADPMSPKLAFAFMPEFEADA
jgi:hypothetical protein